MKTASDFFFQFYFKNEITQFWTTIWFNMLVLTNQQCIYALCTFTKSFYEYFCLKKMHLIFIPSDSFAITIWCRRSRWHRGKKDRDWLGVSQTFNEQRNKWHHFEDKMLKIEDIGIIANEYSNTCSTVCHQHQLQPYNLILIGKLAKWCFSSRKYSQNVCLFVYNNNNTTTTSETTK